MAEKGFGTRVAIVAPASSRLDSTPTSSGCSTSLPQPQKRPFSNA